MKVRPTEYGRRGILGIGTPQANPTVEQELWLLRPDGVSLVTARLVSSKEDSRTRLGDYLAQLADTLIRFDALQLDAFGFACTGSTYLCGHGAERAQVAALEQRFGYPVITAADAIETALHFLGARRIAFIAPYPNWLGELGKTYWEGRGFDVASVGLAALKSADTRNIYALGSEAGIAQMRALDASNVDAVVFSGTGMPNLRALLTARDEGRAALSSNLCLAWLLARRIGLIADSVAPMDLLVARRAAVDTL